MLSYNRMEPIYLTNTGIDVCLSKALIARLEPDCMFCATESSPSWAESPVIDTGDNHYTVHMDDKCFRLLLTYLRGHHTSWTMNPTEFLNFQHDVRLMGMTNLAEKLAPYVADSINMIDITEENRTSAGEELLELFESYVDIIALVSPSPSANRMAREMLRGIVNDLGNSAFGRLVLSGWYELMMSDTGSRYSGRLAVLSVIRSIMSSLTLTSTSTSSAPAEATHAETTTSTSAPVGATPAANASSAVLSSVFSSMMSAMLSTDTSALMTSLLQTPPPLSPTEAQQVQQVQQAQQVQIAQMMMMPDMAAAPVPIIYAGSESSRSSDRSPIPIIESHEYLSEEEDTGPIHMIHRAQRS